MREVRTGRAADVVLSWLPWGIFAAAVVVGFIVEGPAAERVSPVHQLIWSGLFFAALLVRVLRSIRTSPGRTSVLLALFIGVLLWLLGSASLSTSEAGATVSFPGPGEWLFLAAYLGLAAFVFLDGQPSTALRSATAWADAAIVCGGAAAVSAAVVLTPLSRAYPDSGVALLVALIYPTLDLALALMVIAQWALGARPGSWRTILMGVGFTLLLLADVSLVVGVPSGIYASTYVADVLWTAAFGVLVQAACMRDVATAALRLGMFRGGCWSPVSGSPCCSSLCGRPAWSAPSSPRRPPWSSLRPAGASCSPSVRPDRPRMRCASRRWTTSLVCPIVARCCAVWTTSSPTAGAPAFC